LISCSEETKLNESYDLAGRSFRGAFGYNDAEVAKEQLGKYMFFGTYTNFVARLDITKISSGVSNGLILLNYAPESGQPSEDAGEVSINGITSTWNEDLSRYQQNIENASDLTGILSSECFGKNVTFTIDRPEFEYTNEMYIPEEISIQSLTDEGIVSGSYTHRVSRNSLNLTWNSDSNNDNGVLAIARWDGTMSDTELGAPNNGFLVEKAVVLNDSGSATLPSNLFEGIPTDAKVSFNLIRGNFDIIEGLDGKTYKNYGITFDKKKFLMID